MKEHIINLTNSNIDEIYKLLSNTKDNTILYNVLKNLGRLPDNFNGDYLIPLLSHENDKIRLLTIKNLGKLANNKYLSVIINFAKNEANTMIRRESMSAIGRMRSETSIPILTDMLSDKDPKVVIQAIRGLLVFKNNGEVREIVYSLRNHPNEIIQSVIDAEFNGITKKSNGLQNHITFPNYLKNVIVLGDVKEILSKIPDESVHLTFTSPPYYKCKRLFDLPKL